MARSFTSKHVYQFEAPVSRVFQALVDPKVLVQWFLAPAKVDPRKGGKFRFVWTGGSEMSSRLLAYTRNRSISFLWKGRLPNGKWAEAEVTFRVSKKGRGAVLTLRHSGFLLPEHYAECSARWAYYLTNLKSVLDHGADLRSPHDR